MKQGMTLVEQEMPASISFHVPDQYHKRIIGIGGQHIQRIMKKHSVFVKFSNAMDRGMNLPRQRGQGSGLLTGVLGGMGREDDDVKVDNVICRTPARNAQNLELVKTEILDMVDRAVSRGHFESIRYIQVTNMSFRSIPSSLLRLCTLTASTIDSLLLVCKRLRNLRRSGIARLSFPAPSRLVMR